MCWDLTVRSLIVNNSLFILGRRLLPKSQLLASIRSLRGRNPVLSEFK